MYTIAVVCQPLRTKNSWEENHSTGHVHVSSFILKTQRSLRFQIMFPSSCVHSVSSRECGHRTQMQVFAEIKSLFKLRTKQNWTESVLWVVTLNKKQLWKKWNYKIPAAKAKNELQNNKQKQWTGKDQGRRGLFKHKARGTRVKTISGGQTTGHRWHIPGREHDPKRDKGLLRL